MDDKQQEIPEGEIYDLSPLPDGINIHLAAVMACLIARIRRVMVRFRFNFATIVIEPGVTPDEVVDKYHEMIAEHKDEIEASPQFKHWKALRTADEKQAN